MKSRFLLVSVLLWLGYALLGLPQALASHAQAGELTYFSLGNNQYRVRVTFFKDCGGIAAPATFSLQCSRAGCNGAAVTATLVPPAGFPTGTGSYTSYQPYCGSVAASQPLCNPNSTNSNALTNTISINYEATVTLPPAAEWILSVEESSRPTVANISSATLRLEATLNNLITPVGGGTSVTIVNNSPQFTPLTLPVPFVCWKQQTTLNFNTSDVDRLNGGRADSVVYTLDRPLTGCGIYETYLPYPGNACTPSVINGSCILTCSPNLGSTYSATLPIAVANDTIGTCVPGRVSTLIVQPHFSFNSQTGSFTFTPNRYLNTPSGNGDNKYAVVGKATEYRKINGHYYKVGSVRRDFLVIVIDCGQNGVPGIPTGHVADPLSQAVISQNRDTTRLTVRTCNYSRVSFNFTDPDNIVTPTHPVSANQNLTIFYPVDINTNALQNGDIGSFSITSNGTTSPYGTFYFQPSPSSAGTRVIIPFRVEDNACPAKGIQYRTLIIDVVNGNSVQIGAGSTNLTGVPSATICTGTNLLLTGNVQRPDSVHSATTGHVVAQVYSYQWTAAATGGLPANTTTRVIQVAPTATTRYFVRVAPTMGFSGGCGDTTSVLVRVVPQPAMPVITRVGNTLTSSATAGNQWYLNGQAILGATGQIFNANTPGSYTVVTSVGTLPLACSSPVSAALLGNRMTLPGTSLSVTPNPTADGHFQVQLTGYHEPVTLAVFDALGRQVTTATVATPNPAGTTQAVDLSGMATGVYILRVLTAGGVDVRRVVRE